MKALPPTATDEEIFRFLDGWTTLLAADKYEDAFAYVDSFPMSGWSPNRMRGALKNNEHKNRTQVIYIREVPKNTPQLKQLVRWKDSRTGYFGSLIYPFNLVASQFTATFLLYLSKEGISLQLTDIYDG